MLYKKYIPITRDTAPYSLVYKYQTFSEAFSLQLRDIPHFYNYPERGGNRLLRKVASAHSVNPRILTSISLATTHRENQISGVLPSLL